MTPEPSLAVFLIQLSAIPLVILWGILCLWVHKRWKKVFNNIPKVKRKIQQFPFFILRSLVGIGMLIGYAMAVIIAPSVIIWIILMAVAYNFWGWNF